MSDTDFETMYREWLKAHMTSIVPPPIDEVRAWWHHAHRPPLAERIAEAVLRVAADEQPYPRKAPTTFVEQATEVGLTMKMVKAIQRVLDEEGETQ